MEWFKARKKPVVVDVREVEPKVDVFSPETQTWVKGELINTPEGLMIAIVDRDFIIRGVQGEMYPIKKEIFYQTYEIVEEGE